jgi:hypothetical protein
MTKTEDVTITQSIPSQLVEWMEELADAHAEMEASDKVLFARQVAVQVRERLATVEGPFQARIAEAEREIRATVNILQRSVETDRVKAKYFRASEAPYYPAEDLRRVLLLYPDTARVLHPIQKVRYAPARVDIRVKDQVEQEARHGI